MAPFNGFQILQMLSADSDDCETKEFALTASVINEEVERLRTSGFDGAIGKPLSLASPSSSSAF